VAGSVGRGQGLGEQAVGGGPRLEVGGRRDLAPQMVCHGQGGGQIGRGGDGARGE
jgi:hypothetical protein